MFINGVAVNSRDGGLKVSKTIPWIVRANLITRFFLITVSSITLLLLTTHFH